MKKIFALLIALAMIASSMIVFSACAESTNSSDDDTTEESASVKIAGTYTLTYVNGKPVEEGLTEAAQEEGTFRDTVEELAKQYLQDGQDVLEVFDKVVDAAVEGYKTMMIKLNEDGTANEQNNGVSTTGTWTLEGDNFTLTLNEEVTKGVIKEGNLVLESDGLTLTFVRQ